MKLHFAEISEMTFCAAADSLTMVLMCHLYQASFLLDFEGKQAAMCLPAVMNLSHLSIIGKRQHNPTVSFTFHSWCGPVFASHHGLKNWVWIQVRNGRWEDSGLLFGSWEYSTRSPPTHTLPTFYKQVKNNLNTIFCILFVNCITKSIFIYFTFLNSFA